MSIIVCAFNAQEFIAQTLDSVLAQTYTSIEIIVVDDGSTDSTAATIFSYQPRIRYLFQENQGVCVARNRGVTESSGQYLIFFDADDLMPQDRIARHVAYMESHLDLGLSFVDYKNFDEDGLASVTHFQTCPRLQRILRGKSEIVLNNACRDLLYEQFAITGTMMIRRDMFRYESGFDAELRAATDLNFCYRVARHTPVGLANSVGMLRRLHDKNTSRNPRTILPARIQNFKKLLLTEKKIELRFLLRKSLSNAYTELARYEANNGYLLIAVKLEARAFFVHPLPHNLTSAAKNIIRATAIALGFFRSTDI